MGREPGLVDRCSPCTQEVEVLTSTEGTCPNHFSDPVDQDICTQCTLSWKIVVSEWRSVTVVSLNVGGGVPLIKPAKLCMCTQNTTKTMRTDAWRWVCGAVVPYRWATRGTSLPDWNTHMYMYVRYHCFPALLTSRLLCTHCCSKSTVLKPHCLLQFLINDPLYVWLCEDFWNFKHFPNSYGILEMLNFCAVY